MFVSYNKVRMNDTDAAGILYFANQFRFVHDAWEDLAEAENVSFQKILKEEDFILVIVHVEGDYLAPLQIGDVLEIETEVEKIGNSSFTIEYRIFKQDSQLVGKAKTTHVTLDKKTKKKITIPQYFQKILQKHLKAES